MAPCPPCGPYVLIDSDGKQYPALGCGNLQETPCGLTYPGPRGWCCAGFIVQQVFLVAQVQGTAYLPKSMGGGTRLGGLYSRGGSYQRFEPSKWGGFPVNLP